MGPSHPIKTKDFGKGGTSGDRPTPVFMERDRPSPLMVYKMKKRDGVGRRLEPGAQSIGAQH